MASFQTEYLRRAADVAMILVELFEDVVALISRARLVQSGTLDACDFAATVAVNQGWQMLSFKSRGSRIHDHDALDHIAQLTNISRPRIAHQNTYGIVGDLSRTTAICGCKFL